MYSVNEYRLQTTQSISNICLQHRGGNLCVSFITNDRLIFKCNSIKLTREISEVFYACYDLMREVFNREDDETMRGREEKEKVEGREVKGGLKVQRRG